MSTTSNTLKPSYNPLLWAQLRPSTRPGPSDPSQNVVSAIPLMPENKMNTSLRVVLHDTKSALEQFSDRLGKLVDGVEHAKREIDKVGNCFAEGQDKVLEELNISVNRSQKGLLETLGSPAQATVLEEVKNSQGETNRKLSLLEDKAELVQRQLHTISEQQGHILTSLATITPLAPLLRDSPQQQTQILSTLTSLLPLLPLLQSLPAQIKASQKEAFGSFTKYTAELGRSICLSSPQTYNHTEPCASIPLSSDPLHQQYVNHKPSRSDAVDEKQQQQQQQLQRQSTPTLPISHTLNSKMLNTSCFGDHSIDSHIRQPVTTSDSMSSEPAHKPTFPTDLGPGNSSLDMQPLLKPPSETENSRDRKRPRLASNIDSQNKDMLPRKITPGDTVTPSRTFSNKTSHVRSRSGTAGTKAINRNDSFRSAVPIVSRGLSSIYRDPIPTSQVPDAFSPLRTTGPDRLQDAALPAFDRMPALPLRPKRSMAKGLFRMTTADCFPSSTPSFARRGIPPKICTPSKADVKHPEDISSNSTYLNHIDEHGSSTGLSRKQLVRRNSQQRKLLNEDADEDVEIDLDWGDVTSN